jgi:flagellar hook-length control protein FliK
MSAAVSPVSTPSPQASLPTPAPKGTNGFAQMLSDAVAPQADAAPAAEAAPEAPATPAPKNTRPAQGKAQAADHAPAKGGKAGKPAVEGDAKSDKSDKVDAKHLRGEKQERAKATETDATATVTPTPVTPQPEQKPVDVSAASQLAAQAAAAQNGEAVAPQEEGVEDSKGKGHRPLRIGAGEGEGAAARGRGTEKAESRPAETAQRAETRTSSAAAWQAAAEHAALPVNGESAKAEVAALNAAVGANAALSAPVAAKPAEAAAATPVHVPVPVTSPEFPQALGVQISVLARDGIQQAELHLNPAEMGPLSIKIAIEGSQAQVNFGADSAVTRNAIENGLPELATALREAGFTLSGGGVHQQASGRRDGGQDGETNQDGSRGVNRVSNNGEVPAAQSVTLRGRTSAGGVDLYA